MTKCSETLLDPSHKTKGRQHHQTLAPLRGSPPDGKESQQPETCSQLQLDMAPWYFEKVHQKRYQSAPVIDFYEKSSKGSRMLGDVCYQRVDGVASTRSSKRLRAPLRHNEDLMCSWHFEISCGPLDKKPQFGACAHAVIPHWLTALPQLFPKLHGPNGPKAPRCGVAWWLPW